MIIVEDQIQIGNWSMHNGCLFGTNDIKIFVKHQSIMNHFSTMTPTLFGSDALLVLLLVILLCVLNNKKVICKIHVQANYKRDEVQADHLHPSVHRRGKRDVAGRRERAIERGRVPVEMNEANSENEQVTYDISFTLAATLMNLLSTYQVLMVVGAGRGPLVRASLQV